MQRKKTAIAASAPPPAGWHEAFFRAVIEHAGEGIGMFAADGTTLYLSPQVEPLLGIVAANYLGRPLFDAVAPEQRADIQAQFASLAGRPGAVVAVEAALLHESGRRVLVAASATNLLHVPAVGGIVVNYRDITHRRRAEHALRESEERFRTLFQKSADAMLILGKHGALECNRAAIELLRAPGREALLGTTPLDLAPARQPNGRDSTEMGDAMVERARANGHHRFEWTLIRLDGSSVALDVTMTAILLHGRTVLHCLLRDINARQAMEQRLYDQESHLRAIIDHTPECLKLLDRDGCLLDMNPAGLRMVDAERVEELRGHCVYPMVDEADRQRFIDNVAAVFRGESATQCYRMVSLKGTRRWVDSSSVPLWDSPRHREVRALLVVTRDVTERRNQELVLQRDKAALEASVRKRTSDLEASNEKLSQAMNQLVQSEKLASLGNLVAGIAHELNTPLGNSLTVASSLQERVDALTRLLGDGQLRKSQLDEFVTMCREAARLLERNTRRAAEMLSSFKQIAVDQTSMRRRSFDLQDLMLEIGNTLLPLFAPTRHRLVIDVPAGIAMDTYPGPLEQIVTNLAGNALTHAFGADDAGVVEIRATEATMGHIDILVHDNGAGMAAEAVTHAFDPFFTTRTGGGSSGLGLYIVHNLVTGVLGGRVDVKSQPSHGTEVHVVIPRTAPPRAQT